MGQPEVTTLINAHREGPLLDPTLRSAMLMSERAKAQGLAVQVGLVLDRPDAATLAVAEGFRTQLAFCETQSFGDLGLARNYGIERCKTSWITLCDGDDLWDPLWLIKAFNFQSQLREPNNAILRPEWFVGFGAESFLRRQIQSSDSHFSPFDLIQNWYFCNDALIPRELYLRSPLRSNDANRGFGGEDWHWACESLLRGVQHLTVPDSAYFYRRRRDMTSLGHQPFRIVPPTQLFDPAEVRARAEPPGPPPRNRPLTTLRQQLQWRAQGYPAVFRHLETLKQRLRPERTSSAVESTLASSWWKKTVECLDSIEPLIALEMQSPRDVTPSTQTQAGQAYQRLCWVAGETPPRQLVVTPDPWVANPRAGVMLQTPSFAVVPPRRWFSAPSTCALNLVDLSFEEAVTTLTRWVLQTRPDSVVIDNCPVGLTMLVRHGRSLWEHTQFEVQVRLHQRRPHPLPGLDPDELMHLLQEQQVHQHGVKFSVAGANDRGATAKPFTHGKQGSLS